MIDEKREGKIFSKKPGNFVFAKHIIYAYARTRVKIKSVKPIGSDFLTAKKKIKNFFEESKLGLKIF